MPKSAFVSPGEFKRAVGEARVIGVAFFPTNERCKQARAALAGEFPTRRFRTRKIAHSGEWPERYLLEIDEMQRPTEDWYQAVYRASDWANWHRDAYWRIYAAESAIDGWPQDRRKEKVVDTGGISHLVKDTTSAYFNAPRPLYGQQLNLPMDYDAEGRFHAKVDPIADERAPDWLDGNDKLDAVMITWITLSDHRNRVLEWWHNDATPNGRFRGHDIAGIEFTERDLDIFYRQDHRGIVGPLLADEVVTDD